MDPPYEPSSSQVSYSMQAYTIRPAGARNDNERYDSPPPSYESVYPDAPPAYSYPFGKHDGTAIDTTETPNATQREHQETGAAATTMEITDVTESGTNRRRTQPREPDLPELPQFSKRLNCGLQMMGLGLIIIGFCGLKFYFFGYSLFVGVWAGVLTLLVTKGCADPRNSSPDYNNRSYFGYFNAFTMISVVVFLGWHGRGLTIDKQFLEKCDTFNESVRICRDMKTYGLADYVTLPVNEYEVTSRILLQATGIAFSAGIFLSLFLRWVKLWPLPGQVRPIAPNDLPPLPRSVRYASNLEFLFCSIGLITIGGIGYKYSMFGYKVSVGIWAGILVLGSSVFFDDPRTKPPKFDQRTIFLFSNALKLISVLVFIGWHSRGLTVDQQFLTCHYNISGFRTFCPEIDSFGLDSQVFYPRDYYETIARLILQAIGIFFSVLVIAFTAHRWHQTKDLPGLSSSTPNQPV